MTAELAIEDLEVTARTLEPLVEAFRGTIYGIQVMATEQLVHQIITQAKENNANTFVG